MITISDAMLRDMKRACWMYDCYKCRHAKYGEEAAHCMEDVDDCHECTWDCACRTCDEGSNCEWSVDKVPLSTSEIDQLNENSAVWVEVKDGSLRCTPARWIQLGKISARVVRGINGWEETVLGQNDYGKTWRCWREKHPMSSGTVSPVTAA